MVPSTPNVSRNSKWFLLRGPGDEYSARERVLHIEASADKPYTYAQDTCRIRVKVDNNSGKHVHAIKVKLKQLWTYSYVITNNITHCVEEDTLKNSPFTNTSTEIATSHWDKSLTMQTSMLLFLTWILSHLLSKHPWLKLLIMWLSLHRLELELT